MRVNLHQTVHGLLKNVDSRNAVMAYLGAVLRTNEKRTQIQADEGHSARDGFMLNVLVLLQKLSQKIKLDRVHMAYPFHAEALVHIVKDTKVRFTSDEYGEWLAEFKASGAVGAAFESNFQTQCWFMTLHAHHIAIMPAIQRYSRRLRAIKEFQRLVNELNATKSQWEFSPYAARNKQMHAKWTQQMKKLTQLKICYDIGLLDAHLVRGCMQFYSSVCEYLLHQMEDRPIRAGQPFINTVPPPQLKPTSAFSALPEWYVEDIADFLLFCMQYGTVDWIEYDIDHSIVTWLLTTVCAPQCIKNPYVLAKLVEVLFVTPQNQNLHNLIMFHPIAQSVLVSSLMKFYVDIETTGNVSKMGENGRGVSRGFLL